MKASHVVLVLAVCLPVLLASRSKRSLWGLRSQILCTIPGIWPLIDYADYGCYCGKGGSGIPVDALDTCCQTHDHCYNAAMADKACTPYLDNPYTYGYHQTCDKSTKTVTCLSSNNACQMFICECDKNAAMCFSKSKYIPAHDHYDQELCSK
ncbi:unnamed protein product [Lota lota]